MGNDQLEQLDLQAWYHLRIEVATSMFDLKTVSAYLLTRYAKEGRVWFGGGLAVNARLTKRERRLFLEFLRRNNLLDMLDLPGSLDDGRRWRGRRHGKNKDQPDAGGSGVPGVAEIDWGSTPLFRADDERARLGEAERGEDRGAAQAETPRDTGADDAIDRNGVEK